MREGRSIFTICDAAAFEQAALAMFNYQAIHSPVYKDFIANLKINIAAVNTLKSIPFLPVSFFKSHTLKSDTAQDEIVFSSSATTGMMQSKHHVTDLSLYEQSYLQGFEQFYGPLTDYCLLALLPSYQERDGSSLIYMVDDMIEKTQHPLSGYFLNNNAALHSTLLHLKEKKQKTILVGVTYALLDFVEEFQLDFPELIVMETGGMKGKRKEMVREELHTLLTAGFGVTKIHSEYGMTELLSQAYSKGDGLFNCAGWMKVMIRDINDPLSYVDGNKTGGINIIDLANVNSCAFIATQDLGKLHDPSSFEVLGRFDNADIRGCNLLVQ